VRPTSCLLALGILWGPASSYPLWAEAAAEAEEKKYVIRSGDLLNMSVYPQAELSGKYVVLEDGRVILPTVGRVQVRGLTMEKANRLLAKELSRYFVKPKVSLSVVKFSRRHVVLVGEVRSPGLVRHEEGMTLSEMIVRVGGFTSNADRKSVRVYRGDPKKQDVKIVDVDAILVGGDISRDFTLEPGDRVEVPRRVNVVFLWGAVATPGSYDYLEGMKMLDLIARAGGIDQFAKAGSVRIFRDGGEVLEVDFATVLNGNVGEDVELRAGDIVYMPHIAFARAARWASLLQPYLVLINFLVTVAALIILL